MGVYETYRGQTVEIVEERGQQCSDPSHQQGRPTAESTAPRRPEHHAA